MFNFAPMLIGAAVGAGTSALFGGNPLRGGLLGGVSGGLFGGGLFDELLKKTAAGGAASGLNTVGAAAAPSAAQGAAGQAGLVFNPATGSFINPEYYALASSANPIYTGAGSLGSQVSTGIGSLLDTPTMQGLREYMPSGQALGNLGLQSAMQPRPSVQAPAGGITQGRAPDVAAIQNLVSSMRRKPPQGILGDYFG
jgi:hypothetical protein